MDQPYCIITPAYNETCNIDRLVTSVVEQDKLPVIWVIVNDGSSDDTGTKIDRYASKYDFISCVHLERDNVESYYSRKIIAFIEGYKFLQSKKVLYDYIGNLDADISLPADYYSNILTEFSQNSTLGIAAGRYIYPDTSRKPILSETSAPGSILVFRRQCFEEIGGYLPLRYGAEDALACIQAQSKNWEVRMFPEYVALQHRIVGSATGMKFCTARFRQGLSEYDIGYHPLYSFLKFLYRLFIEKPVILSSLSRYLGYLSGGCIIRNRVVPAKTVAFLRKNQIKRLFKTP